MIILCVYFFFFFFFLLFGCGLGELGVFSNTIFTASASATHVSSPCQHQSIFNFWHSVHLPRSASTGSAIDTHHSGGMTSKLIITSLFWLTSWGSHGYRILCMSDASSTFDEYKFHWNLGCGIPTRSSINIALLRMIVKYCAKLFLEQSRMRMSHSIAALL